MRHIMLDLETMGLRPDAAIVSIGACHFDEKGVYGSFETPVNLASCTAAGLTMDQSTVDWWVKQSVEAQSAWRRPDAPSLLDALTEFSEWLRKLSLGYEIAVWGNGAAFDPVLMESAYRALGADPPWKYYNVMCFRTMKNLHHDVAAPAFVGEKHNARHDAIHQASHLVKILATKVIALR